MPSTLFRILPAVAALALASAAHSQGSGLVSVDLIGVHEPLAQRMGVDPARMPMSILAPAAVAAAACGVRPETLSVARGGGGCTASTPVAGLDVIVRDRMRENEAMGGPPAASAGATGPTGLPGSKPMPAEKP